MRRLLRARVIRAYERADTLTLLGRDGILRRLAGDSAALVRAVLAFTGAPRTREEILAHVAELSGAASEEAAAAESGSAAPPWVGVVDETLALLEATGALEAAGGGRDGRGEGSRSGSSAGEGGAARGAGGRGVRLVLGLTGAIGSMYAPSLVELLLARGFDVRVATTRNALRFVRPLALEALTHHPVTTSLWPKDPSAPVPHLDLARWADLVVVYPASATTIFRIAQGSCESVVSAIAISARVPVLLVPAMNETMRTAPSVQRNLELLLEDGFLVTLSSTGFEVADAPQARAPMQGSAPPLGAVVELIAAIAAHDLPRREGGEAPNAGPKGGVSTGPVEEDWDALYGRAERIEDLPWFTEALDEDIAAALDGLKGGPEEGGGARTLLDVGTGPGTAAIAAARRGFFVVATDVSLRALEMARSRAGDLPIAWMIDDVLTTRLRGTFDVVVDRGCLHVLPEARHAGYANAIAGFVRPGGRLLLKCHSAAEALELGTRRFTAGEIAALMGDAFDMVHAEETTFPGPEGRAPRALLCELRRR